MLHKIKENVIKNKNIYLNLLLLLLVFTGMFFINRYAVDTYYLEAYGYKNNAFHPYLKDGRIFMTIFLGVMALCNISFQTMKVISWLLAVCSLYISMILMYRILERLLKKHTILKCCISFGLIFNIFVTEFFMFPEYTGIMCFGILLTTITTYFLILYFEQKKKTYLMIAYFAAFCSAFCYQGCLSLLVLLSIIFTLKYAKNIKEFIVNNISIAGGYALASVTTLTLSKILGSSRVEAAEFNLVTSLSKIKDGLLRLLKTTFQILPDYMFVILTILAILIVIYALIKQKEPIYKYLFLIYVVCAVIIVTLIPHIMINPNSIWIIPRSNIGLGLLFIVPIVFYILYIKENQYITYVLMILLITLMIFQFVGMTKYFMNQNKNNILDYQAALEIKKAVLEYEQEHEKMTKVVIYPSEVPIYQYPGVVASGDVNIRTFSIDWASESMISFILGRPLEHGEDDIKMKQKCQEKMKQNSNQNYVMYQDTTIYVCTY